MKNCVNPYMEIKVIMINLEKDSIGSILSEDKPSPQQDSGDSKGGKK